MANPITDTVTKDALGQMKLLREETRLAQEEILKLSQNALTASRNLSSIKTPSGFNANSSSNANTTVGIQQQTAIIIASQDKIEKAYEKTRLAEIRLQQQREKSIDSFVKNEQKEQQVLARSETMYNRIQASVNLLTKTYQDLAIRKQLGSQLTIKEEAQLLSITNRLNTYQTALKKVDSDIQKHTRNVGNYASGFNGLGNSINQITRELPAFTFSAQTGFLALSNNIPILTDEIGKLQKANKELVAQGLPVKSVFSQILSSVFSLQTAMGIGILAFTLYGKEITSFFSSIFGGVKSFDALKEGIKAVSEASKEGAKNAVQETLALQSNLSIAKDVTLSYKDRLIAVDNLQKQYPYYFENLTKEQILAGDTAKAEEALTLAILSRAKANASVTKITENQGKIIDLEEKRIGVVNMLRQAEERLRATQNRTNAASASETAYQTEVNSIRAVASQKENLADIDKEIADLNAINNRLTTYALDNQKKSIGLDYQKIKSGAEQKREHIKGLEELNQANNSVEIWLKKLLKAEQDLLEQTNNPDERQERIKDIKFLEEALKALNGTEYMLLESAKKSTDEFEKRHYAIQQNTEDIEKLSKATEEFIERTSKGFLKDAGLGSLDIFLGLDENGKSPFQNLIDGADTLKEKFAVTFLAISEVAQEAFNFINQASQKNFDAEYKRLEMQKEVALQFAGESTSAQEEIKRQYDERRKAIQQREAEAQKKLAVFNILINTAQGVVSALASTPPNVPLSIAIGLIGALQAGIVQSQPIPQFFEGGTHKGGIMMVNDAKGNSYKETVVTPDGKVIKPQGRNVLMNAPAGTEIFTPEQWKEKEMALGNILAERGISFSPNVLRNFAFNGNTSLSKSDFDNGISKLSGTIKSIPTSEVKFDELGYRKFQKQNGIKKERLNRRFNINGK